jgi:hypothetical protein
MADSEEEALFNDFEGELFISLESSQFLDGVLGSALEVGHEVFERAPECRVRVLPLSAALDALSAVANEVHN